MRKLGKLQVWAQLPNPCDQLSHQNGALWNLDKIMKIGQKCEILQKKINLVEIVPSL